MALSRDTVGGMNRRLRLEQDNPVEKDGQGAWVSRWQPVLNTEDGCCWADVEDLSGREYFNAAQVQADVDCRITIWECGKTITPDLRFVDPFDGDTIYEIVSAVHIERRTKWEIMARRTVTNPRA